LLLSCYTAVFADIRNGVCCGANPMKYLRKTTFNKSTPLSRHGLFWIQRVYQFHHQST